VKRLILALLIACPASAADDSWLSVFDAQDVVLYVDAATGSDSNTGGPGDPFATIHKGLQVAISNKNPANGPLSTRVVVSPGTYREQSNALFGHVNEKAIVLEGSGPGVIVSGSEIYTAWSLESGSIYSHAWAFDWGPSAEPPGWPPIPEITLRTEMVFEDGARLRQVLTYPELGAGTYFVDEVADRLYIWPTDGTLDSEVVEVSERRRGIQTQSTNNIAIKNMKFQHVASEIQSADGLTFSATDGIYIKDVEASDNNWRGISINGPATDVVARDVRVDANGMVGSTTNKQKNAIWEDVHAHLNNWRGDLGGFHGWAAAGSKHFSCHDCFYARWTISQNYGRGFWWDNDVVDTTMDDMLVVNNLWSGIFFEAIQGPIALTGSTLNGNGKNGLVTGNVELLTLQNAVLRNNADAGLRVDGNVPTRSVIDFETGIPQDVTICDDWIIDTVEIVGDPTIETPAINPDIEACPGISITDLTESGPGPGCGLLGIEVCIAGMIAAWRRR
jgi:hypothetical protein